MHLYFRTNQCQIAIAAIALAAGLAGSAAADPSPPPAPGEGQPKEEKKTADPGIDAGWNGDHFFLKNADSSYVFQPSGYIQTDDRIYSGDGVPPNTFAIRRARLGFQGKLERYYEFAFL